MLSTSRSASQFGVRHASSGFFGPIKAIIENRNKPVVSVVNLHGMIMAAQGSEFGGQRRLNLESRRRAIDQAFKPKKLEAVLLSINSPGGSAVQSELIADYIALKAQERKVPVFSFVEDMAASGGYWLACAGEKIYVSRSSIVGSIGVIAASFGLHQLIDKWGIERRVYTAGTSKSINDPFKEMNDKDREIIQRTLNVIHDNFKVHVRHSRTNRLSASEDTLFNGEFWVGQEAVNLGLADEVMGLEAYVQKQYGKKVNVKRFGGKQSPLAGLFGAEQQGFGGLTQQQILGAIQQESFTLADRIKIQ